MMSHRKIYYLNDYWKEHAFVVLGLVLMMLLTACGVLVGAAQPQAMSDQDLFQADEIGGYVELVDALRAHSLNVEPLSKIDQPFFDVQGQLIGVNGADVQVFEFSDEAAREAAAALISPDGSSIGTTMISWDDQPNFWKKGRVIVLYVGRDAATIELLTSLLGEPIAQGRSQQAGDSLVNTSWTLVSFGWPGAEMQGAATPVVEGSSVTLEFADGGLVGGSGGCNTFVTQYQVQDKNLIFAQIVSTLVACASERINQQEQLYYQALENAAEFELYEDHLVIWYGDGQSLLYFVKLQESTATPVPSPTPCATAHPTSTPTPAASQPTPAPERIHFQTGATSAVLSGSLPASGSDIYVLRALGEQSMTVELTFSEGQAILAIWGEDGTVLLSDHAEATRFQGILPSTQDYFILLKGRPDGSSSYTMRIVIPPLPSS